LSFCLTKWHCQVQQPGVRWQVALSVGCKVCWHWNNHTADRIFVCIEWKLFRLSSRHSVGAIITPFSHFLQTSGEAGTEGGVWSWSNTIQCAKEGLNSVLKICWYNKKKKRNLSEKKCIILFNPVNAMKNNFFLAPEYLEGFFSLKMYTSHLHYMKQEWNNTVYQFFSACIQFPLCSRRFPNRGK
jgi:hypothetical protein